MAKYEVTFEFTTSTIIEVDAKDDIEAQFKAQAVMNERDVDSLPEMWPTDYVVTKVEEF
jgi:hypothetical protein